MKKYAHLISGLRKQREGKQKENEKEKHKEEDMLNIQVITHLHQDLSHQKKNLLFHGLQDH